jgi:hypothetical protein
MTSDPGNSWWVGPCGSFHDHISPAGGKLGNVVDVEDAMSCFEWVVEGFEKGALFVTWREPVLSTQ